MAPARDAGGKLVLILHDDDERQDLRRHAEGPDAAAHGDVTVDALGHRRRGQGLHARQGRRALRARQAARATTRCRRRATPRSSRRASTQRGRARSRRCATTRSATPSSGSRTARSSRDNGRGSFVAARRRGARAGLEDLRRLPQLRQDRPRPARPRAVPARASSGRSSSRRSTVLLSFALGLFLAITLDKQGCASSGSTARSSSSRTRSRASSRCSSGRGLLNDDFGVVNRLLPHQHPVALRRRTGRRSRCILVSVWLTVPVLLPRLAGRAAVDPGGADRGGAVDGGGPLADLPARDAAAAARRGRAAPDRVVRVQLQQLQQHLPADRRRARTRTTSRSRASTDILISYTYKLAFATGKGSDYGLASAVAIIIFFIVATISGVSFWRTKALENVR